MLIGELSQQVNLSRDTIRFYEKMALIQPLVRNNGYKDYPEQTLQQLKLILTAKNLGFTLTEIKQIIDIIGENEIPATQFNTILQEKLGMIQEKIMQLQHMQNMLENLLGGEPCPLRKECEVNGIE
ncbi:MerR family transcriptional regulator [Acinetobacter tibetensis]|uniref:MerR family transcriptional regulator n=1 Tax=Acinetobacter tibetensis TaxID=2943497 RepID=A0AAE9LTJ2_9GAMM|nr:MULTISPECIES: MerR family transcriptional regulator [Acinetobacter]PWB13471.1 heavy metal-responsive transcriptional regulator [Acinetobacter sp. AM]USE84438.1 MerR family transcriptional regulator [Acinetobacter tibetensis]